MLLIFSEQLAMMIEHPYVAGTDILICLNLQLKMLQWSELYWLYGNAALEVQSSAHTVLKTKYSLHSGDPL